MQTNFHGDSPWGLLTEVVSEEALREACLPEMPEHASGGQLS